MIYKEKRANSDKFDLKIVDKFGNLLTMTIGGNLDLYWVVQDDVHDYTIEKNDKIVFDAMVKLFQNVKKDDVYGCLSGDGRILSYVSEDVEFEYADNLQIKRNDDSFELHFIKNEKPAPFFLYKPQPNICFCNNGSIAPNVEFHFMMMFNQLAYYNKNVLPKDSAMENCVLDKN